MHQLWIWTWLLHTITFLVCISYIAGLVLSRLADCCSVHIILKRTHKKLFLPLQSLKPFPMRIRHFFVFLIVYLSNWIMPTLKVFTLRHSSCYKHISLIHLISHRTRSLFSRKYWIWCLSLAENIECLITHLMLVSIRQQNSSSLSETRLWC